MSRRQPLGLLLALGLLLPASSHPASERILAAEHCDRSPYKAFDGAISICSGDWLLVSGDLGRAVVQVQPDGTVSKMPGIRVVGLTTVELEDLIARRGGLVPLPKVHVAVLPGCRYEPALVQALDRLIRDLQERR